jgi:hypothetical protein
MATQPAYRAYTVIKREGADDFWLAIGAAFPHQSGDGFNIVLQALPLPDKDGQCKLVLRPPKVEELTEAEPRIANGTEREKTIQRRR